MSMDMVLRDDKHKAAKEYRCSWCAEVIEKGELYRRTVIKFDGELQSNSFHVECGKEAAQTDTFDKYENFRPTKL